MISNTIIIADGCTTIQTRTSTTETTQTSTTYKPSSCSDNEFSCGGSPEVCIPSIFQCDSITDCSGSNDEQNCPGNTDYN